MKGLMPLALSPSLSSTCSYSPVEENMVSNKVDGYFPEILARDLEKSSFAFESRSMTAGRPIPSLSIENTDTKQVWPCHLTSSSHPAAPKPGKSLIPIQEQNSAVSFHRPWHTSKFNETSSEDDSMTEECMAKGSGERPISFNDQSIETAATSLGYSSRCTSPKEDPTCGHECRQSWIEADSDDDEPGMHIDALEENLAPLSPRPPTPPESESSRGCSTDSQELHQPLHQSPIYRKNMHRKSHSQQPPGNPLSSSQGHRNSDGPPTTPPPDRRRRASSLHTPTTWKTSHRIDISHNRGDSQGSKSVAALGPTYMGDTGTATGEETVPPAGGGPKTRNRVFIRPSPPPSPLPSVESWLNGATLQYAAQCPGDEMAKAVPLPPDVVETLRVSVACFPETMLLSSSLTIETIRNYSKKVRQPNADPASNSSSSSGSSSGTTMAAPEAPPDSPRRSLWKRVLPYKKSPAPGRHRALLAGTHSDIKASISAPVEPSKPWIPLGNIFVNCSDYILDALWAHILAYNYISALVPRPPPRRTSCRDQADDNNDEIPKKAASLLGLAISTDTFQQNQQDGDRTSGSKLLSPMPWGLVGDGMVADESPRAANHENTAKDIQAGLMRCIIRLIATAKLMTEDGSGQRRVVEMEARGVDVLFTRSLCEIVRVAEESV
ncbi:hypothetical protein GMORB2_7177 [Geosmithia morbida]|uniref:Uncharacterized protein n=1 Tax=Geosmithia morbida TaxID=1094350 RepID=A0A9P5D4J8_9HYPO|nr:uncharacterized protein GMORB2_7177 [Geosmithia morbida]KAF4122870.1 hypothetical protein GMORB2_7177 [Geosmithia morbida]